MAVKKFTPKASKPGTNRKPITFEVYDQKFTTVPALQGAVLLEFVGNAVNSEEDAGSTNRTLKQLIPFFKSALEKESYDRFIAMTRDSETVLELTDLFEIVSWLIEQFTSRPTDGSSD